MIKINNFAKLLLYTIILVVIAFLFLQQVELKNSLGLGHWGKICSQDRVENGEIKSLSAIAFFDKDNCPNDYKSIEVWVKNNNQEKISNTQSQKKLVILSPTQSQKPMPAYSITELTTPILNSGFNFKANIKNISATPFITWIFFNQCKFVDNKGTEYKGSISLPTGDEGIKLTKALLPGESKTVEFNRISVNLYGGGGIQYGSGESSLRCEYDKNGNNLCAPVDGLKFKTCTASIAVGNGKEYQFPLVINFPQ